MPPEAGDCPGLGVGVGATGGVQEQFPFLTPGESASEGSDSLFI